MLVINGSPNVSADLTTISADISTLEGKVDTVDTVVDAVKAKTDNLPVSPCATADVANALVDVKNKDIGATFSASTDSLEAISDKLGVTTDFASNQTLLGYQNSLYQHVHQQAKVYPTLAAGVTVTADNVAWTLGAKTEIIPASTITNAFDIHWINVEAASATDVYEVVLYKGGAGAEIEIGRVRIHKNSVQSGANNCPIQIPAQTANTRISCAIASSSGGGDTLTISVMYHEYS